jgi:hypothetical protein
MTPRVISRLAAVDLAEPGRGLGEEVGGPVEGGGVIGYGDAAPTV